MSSALPAERVTGFEVFLVFGLGALLLFVMAQIATGDQTVHISGRLILPPSVVASGSDTATLVDAVSGEQRGRVKLSGPTMDGVATYYADVGLADHYVIRVGSASATASQAQLRSFGEVRLSQSSSSSE